MLSTANLFGVSVLLCFLVFHDFCMFSSGQSDEHAAYNLSVVDISANDMVIELYANSTGGHRNKTYYVEYSSIGHEDRKHHVVEVTPNVTSNGTEVILHNLTAYTYYNVCVVSMEYGQGAVGGECTIVSTKYDPFNRKAVAAMLVFAAIAVTLITVQLIRLAVDVDETVKDMERRYILELREMREKRKKVKRMSRSREKKKRSDYGSMGASSSRPEQLLDESDQSEEDEEIADPADVLVESTTDAQKTS